VHVNRKVIIIYNGLVLQVSAAAAAAATALWRCYRDVYTTSQLLSWPTETDDVSSVRGDAALLEDVLCSLRQQQLFQLHLLHQLQRQVDQLVVSSRPVTVAPAASSSRLTASPPPRHVTSPMTSHVSPMSAIIDMSRKQLDQLPDYTGTPSTASQ